MENHFNCIYCYTNKINGKKYVGQAKNFNKRHRGHIKQAYNENCRAYNQYFHKAIRKHGTENFEIKILIENLQNQDELNYWECYYIKKLDTLANNGKGYNLSDGGSNGNPFAGKTEEEMAEFSRKISEVINNKTEEEMKEIRRKQSEAHKGENNGMYNKHHSEETRAKISEAHKGENNGMYNKHHLEETRAKISEAYYNKLDEEKAEIHRKQSEAMKGKNKGENNGRAKKVIQKDLNGSIIKIWDYAKQISVELGYNYRTICNYINGRDKGKPYKGYIWEYVE